MPDVHKGESKKNYISRCIPYMKKKEGKSQDQAVAMCHSFYRRHKGKESLTNMAKGK